MKTVDSPLWYFGSSFSKRWLNIPHICKVSFSIESSIESSLYHHYFFSKYLVKLNFSINWWTPYESLRIYVLLWWKWRDYCFKESISIMWNHMDNVRKKYFMSFWTDWDIVNRLKNNQGAFIKEYIDVWIIRLRIKRSYIMIWDMSVTIQESEVDLESDIRTIQLLLLTGHTFCHVNIVGTTGYIGEFTHCFQCRNLSQSSIMDVRTSRRRYGHDVRSAVSDNL